MVRSNWEADKMLDVYIYDYLVKRNLHNSAKAFMNEGKVATDPVAIDAPGGFLFEWWSIFWDIFDARTRDKPHEGGAGAAAPSMDMKSREHQMRLQLLQQQNAHLQRRDPNQPALNGAMNSDVSAVLASKLMEGMRNHNPMDSEASQQLFDANRMALLKSAANQTGQLQGSSVNMAALQQQLQSRNQQVDIKGDGAMQQRTMPTDPSALYGSAMMQSKSGLAASGG